MRKSSGHILFHTVIGLFLGIYSLNAISALSPEPDIMSTQEIVQDTTKKAAPASQPRYPVSKTVPETYQDVEKQHPIDLHDPENVKTIIEYDPLLDRYLLRTKVGEDDITTPVSMTVSEYLDYTIRQSMGAYFKEKNNELLLEDGKEQTFSPFDMKFDLGPAEKLFGPGGVQLQTQGTAEIKMGIKHNSTENPALPERARSRTFFDFDSEINLNVKAKVGDKINFDMNYNTEATFDYDSKKLKLAYEGKEDEIIKVLEAGNVSMRTSNSLIRGGTSLFGVRSELQFGKLRVNTLFSQQNSEAKTVSSRGGVQTTPFELALDQYDENRHFFFAHFFHDTYDEAMSTLPYIKSGITISRIEVWATNKRGRYDEARNIVAFADLGEHKKENIHISGVTPNPNNLGIPYNKANTLYDQLKSLSGARGINQVTQTLEGIGMVGGEDYEKVESARKLEASEYTFNPQLGYISLKTMLQPDEVLAIAIEYTYQGATYQLGEFSTNDPSNTKDNLFLKLIKGTSLSPASYTWRLMMKNIYSLNAYSIQKEKFKLDIMYQSDTTGTYMNYLTEGEVANIPLLRVMNLDRLDARQNPYSDGFFDFVEGYTVVSQNGRIIFPVAEPFGKHLRDKFKNDSTIANKYVFEELYDSTMTVAKQIAEKNKFKMVGEYKASSGTDIQLGAMNIPRGSVQVTAGGVLLTEGTDYSVDYINGVVTILNPSLAESNTPISVSLENQSMYGMQRKSIMGLDLNYEFNKDFNLGATIMHLRETPMTAKANMGDESVRNTLWGFNTAYRTESQWLTNLVDKLPLLDLTAPSQINFKAEFAQLIPGHYESKYGGKHAYVDDFERTEIPYDLRTPHSWFLASTPYDAGEPGKKPLFPEASLSQDVEYGKNRALLAWYYIDGLFTRRNSSLTPQHIKNDKEQLSNHYVREVTELELFPNKEQQYGEPITIPVFNMAFYPNERGPYNVVADFDANGNLKNPKDRWGGIYRKIDQPDFESANIEYIEFWMMDPFIYNKNTSSGGDLYFNLGEISEDILKDERKFAESAMPTNGDTTMLETTVWGRFPKTQSLVYAFESASIHLQDVGLNGLSTADEYNHPTYRRYLDDVQTQLAGSSAVLDRMRQDPFSPLNDPAGDNYHYFRGTDYDRDEVGVLDRYKRYNGLEGNTTSSGDERYETSYKSTPDVEDANQDFTMNENERYFQYKISLHPDSLGEGKGYVTNVHQATVNLANGKEETVHWYQFKIPIRSPQKKIGSIKDFKSIRFMRMFLHNFEEPVILRFGTLELIKGEWRVYAQDLSDPNRVPTENGTIDVASVNIEENADKQPVNYVMPPGVNRVIDPGQPQIRQENEQSLSLTINRLASGDARAVYKNTGMDMRQYGRLQMFAHAEKLINDPTNLQNNEMSIFLRLGSDYKSNYYEYEIPLKLTYPGRYNTYNGADQEAVWPRENMFDFALELLTNLKLERNKEKRKAGSTVTFFTPYSSYDPDKPMNKITVRGNPSLSEIKTVMIGVRNNATDPKSTVVWVNELRLTEFNEEGGWAANANLNIALSDLGNINMAGRIETVGFGGIDQSVTERSLDDFYQYNIGATMELGKLFPEGKVTAPMYYAYSEQVTSPKYNPLDQDVLLKEALDNAGTKAEKDSISGRAQTKTVSKSFNLNNIRLNVASKNPMPYDPSNLSFAYSFTENDNYNPTTEYERTKDYRGALTYSYSPYAKPWQPFKNNKSKSGAAKFIKDISLGYLPSSLSFATNMSRTYYEVKLRDLSSVSGVNSISPSFRQEFYWDRSFSLTWSLTKNLNLSLNTGTQAVIEEPYMQVNKQLHPDKYEVWKDSVWQSIKSFGTPLNYNQTFNATYNFPLKLIPVLDWTTLSTTYNASYNWDKGATLLDVEDELGNTIRNQRTASVTGGLQLMTLYNKSDFLKKANQKYTLKRPASNTRQPARANNNRPAAPVKKEPQKIEKDIQLNMDSATVVTHNLKNKKVRVSAKSPDGKRYELNFKSINENSIRINNKDTANLKLTIIPGPNMEDDFWYKAAQFAARGAMMVRTINISYNITDGMTLPGFLPNVGDAFGQTASNFGYAPGFDFAFGLAGREYIDDAKEKGWLISNSASNIVPAYLSSSKTLDVRATLEPVVGMKVDLTAKHLTTKTTSIQYIYEPVTEQHGGTFTMTTVALGSAFESSNPANNYFSKAFTKFLHNREIIANRLEQKYIGTNYPTGGFFNEINVTGKYDPTLGNVNKNSADVLIPSFLAAYTGSNPNNTAITAFPSIKSLLPNWKISYEGLIQLDVLNKHFKSFVLNHNYVCTYTVGGFSSFLNWVQSPDNDGLGYIQNMNDNPTPSSPYDISLASITEQFSPLIGVDATLTNNMTFKAEMKNARNLNLNVSSYQIVESTTDEIFLEVGYKLTELNKVLKMKPTGAGTRNFSNDLTIRAGFSYKKMQALIRKIEDAFTQATSGNVTSAIKFSADYNLSRALTLRAFFDRDLNRPLVSAASYPTSNSSFGISIQLNLTR